jgi:hypothetical protein
MRFNPRNRSACICVALALPVLVFVSVTVFWHSRGSYRITGDEPHYLLIAESLVRDHDLRVENNYRTDTPVQEATGLDFSRPEHFIPHTQNQFSRHNIGLPIVMSVAYAVGGVLGVKIFMAIIAGLWPFLLYGILFDITSSRIWSVVFALSLAVGLPFTAAGNQVFPDLVAGLIILFVVWKILARLRSKDQNSSSLLFSGAVALLIAFLPWLHVRFGPPAVLLLIAYVISGGRSRWQGRLGQSLAPIAIVISSFVLLGIYHHIAFANIWGPYAGKDVTWQPQEILMILLGLHWDQSQGLFVQQPLFLLGLVGLPLAMKENLSAVIILALLYASVLVPSAMHTALYGGHSFYGRFWWPVLGLWIFPLAYTVRVLLTKARFLLILCVMSSIAFQAWLATKWITHDSFLVNRNLPLWASHSFLEGTKLPGYLPLFVDFNTYLKQPANYVVVAFGVLLMVTAASRRLGARRFLIPVWLAFFITAISVIIYIPPAPFGTWFFQACDLPSKFGTIEGFDRVVNDKEGQGIFTYGPYVKLKPGIYKVKLNYESARSIVAPGRFSVIYNQGNEVVGAELPADTNNGMCEQVFEVNDSQSLNSLFEFRVSYNGRGYLKVKSITLTPVSLAAG